MATALRTAILGVGHWHAKYIFAALADSSTVVAVSDPDPRHARSAAENLHCRSYDDYRRLLDIEEVDAVFIYGRHVDMTGMVAEVIERGIPFAVEKPAGMSAADVARLRDLAADAGVFTSVPFTHRMTPWVEAIRADGSELIHASFRLLSGPPSRYLDNRVPWVLDPKQSGGGCTINLAVLFIDLFAYLTGEAAALERGILSSTAHGTPVEDYSNLLLCAARSGAAATVETGYTFPNAGSDVTCSVRTRDAFYRITDTGFEIVTALDSRMMRCTTHHREYYGDYARRTLTDIAESRSPLATLDDLHRAMLVVDHAYATATWLGTERPHWVSRSAHENH